MKQEMQLKADMTNGEKGKNRKERVNICTEKRFFWDACIHLSYINNSYQQEWNHTSFRWNQTLVFMPSRRIKRKRLVFFIDESCRPSIVQWTFFSFYYSIRKKDVGLQLKSSSKKETWVSIQQGSSKDSVLFVFRFGFERRLWLYRDWSIPFLTWPYYSTHCTLKVPILASSDSTRRSDEVGKYFFFFEITFAFLRRSSLFTVMNQASASVTTYYPPHRNNRVQARILYLFTPGSFETDKTKVSVRVSQWHGKGKPKQKTLFWEDHYLKKPDAHRPKVTETRTLQKGNHPVKAYSGLNPSKFILNTRWGSWFFWWCAIPSCFR